VPTTLELQEMLRGAALRVTRPRLAVLTAVHAHTYACRHGLDHRCRAQGMVRRIQPSGSVARYDSRVGDNHHHIMCRSCGVIVDVDCAVGHAPCPTASDDHGFVIDEAESSTGASAPAVPPNVDGHHRAEPLGQVRAEGVGGHHGDPFA
jgi:Fe2+ or Zn2+ uptake regulation protein